MILLTAKTIQEQGVLPESVENIYTVSDFAKSSLFYCSRSAHFICENGYCRIRQGRNNFLLLYVLSGTIGVHIYDRSYIAESGDIILLDRHKPHDYSCLKDSSFLWFHFNGNSIASYYEYLLSANENSVVFKNEKHTLQYFNDIIFRPNPFVTDEQKISVKIHSILSSLISAPPESGKNYDKTISAAVEYIMSSFKEDITVEKLAQMSGLSVYHFIRQFKDITGHTPHQFLLQYRILQAKLFLEVSDYSSEQIAERCGFNSSSHFSRAFRQLCGVSPMQYRKDSTWGLSHR